MSTATNNTEAKTLQASGSVTAAGTLTGTELSIDDTFGGVVTGRITNGSTGPTLPCTCFIEYSLNNSDWRTLQSVTADVTNSGIYDFTIPIRCVAGYIRSRFTGNTGQAVTAEAFFHQETNVGIS